jgi:predicted HicB family RNase H-like nuclease
MKKGQKQVNVRISGELHAKAKIISVLEGITFNEYLEKAIAKAIEKDKSLLTKIR